MHAILGKGLPVQKVSPLVHHHFDNVGGVSFSVACFGGESWLLGPLNEIDAARLAGALGSVGAKVSYATNMTKNNARIIEREMLCNVRLLATSGIVFRFNKDCPADGTDLVESGDAGLMAGGGCGLLVMSYLNKLVYGHASEKSLVRPALVEDERAKEADHPSVVDTMLNALEVSDSQRHLVYAWPLFAITPTSYHHKLTHPKYGLRTLKLRDLLAREYSDAYWVDREFVHIDLSMIQKTQLMRRGVPEHNIFLEHRYLDGRLPHTRKASGDRRYLAVVVRH